MCVIAIKLFFYKFKGQFLLGLEFSLGAGVSLVLLGVYLIHFWVVYLRHNELLANESTQNQVESLPQGHRWVFLLVTVGLPLICSFCASWVSNPVNVPSGATISMVMPAFLFNMAISIFVLMITIEIGYLYDDRISLWKNYVVAAFVIDFIALLLFLVVIKPPAEVVTGNTVLTLIFFALVSIGSLVSSCGTIYYSKIHSLVSTSEGELDEGQQI
ncbi:hypothetical protein ViNHUV68_41720 [Vibrio sp. NH-UV-68]